MVKCSPIVKWSVIQMVMFLLFRCLLFRSPLVVCSYVSLTWALCESLVHTMKKILFYNFQAFFIVFAYVNACASMRSLTEIHNTHYSWASRFHIHSKSEPFANQPLFDHSWSPLHCNFFQISSSPKNLRKFVTRGRLSEQIADTSSTSRRNSWD